MHTAAVWSICTGEDKISITKCKQITGILDDSASIDDSPLCHAFDDASTCITQALPMVGAEECLLHSHASRLQLKQVVKWQSALILCTTAIREYITMCLRPFCFVCCRTLSVMALTMLPSCMSSVRKIMYSVTF